MKKEAPNIQQKNLKISEIDLLDDKLLNDVLKEIEEKQADEVLANFINDKRENIDDYQESENTSCFTVDCHSEKCENIKKHLEEKG